MAIEMAIRKSGPPGAPKRRYSVAEARDRLPALVHEAQAVPIEITRRGTPVAAIVSIEDYQQILRARQGFGDLYERFRREAAAADLDAASRALVDLRDPSPGRPLP
jgi:prevent-host-death family protein